MAAPIDETIVESSAAGRLRRENALVLIIDDQAQRCATLTGLLEARGFGVWCASSASEARIALGEIRFNAIVDQIGLSETQPGLRKPA